MAEKFHIPLERHPECEMTGAELLAKLQKRGRLPSWASEIDPTMSYTHFDQFNIFDSEAKWSQTYPTVLEPTIRLVGEAVKFMDAEIHRRRALPVRS